VSKTQVKGWLEGKLEDPNFQRLLAREDFIEYFLTEIERTMREQKVTRAELARRMDCRPSNVTQLLRRTRNLTAASMVDLAFHLNLKLRVLIERRESSKINNEAAQLWHRTSTPTSSDGERAIRPLVHIQHDFAAGSVAGTGWTKTGTHSHPIRSLASRSLASQCEMV
jgi:transcriptional regulator with XRE-family HTH domain